jgi:molybdopterin molybdotransferase
MISHADALNIVLNTGFKTEIEYVEVANCHNRVLSQDIFSEINMPPFDKSMVDGYACKINDLSNVLEVIEIIGAGFISNNEVVAGKCIKIMTGAKIPLGTDIVVMVEDVECLENNRIKIICKKSAKNIALKAEDICIGDRILAKGLLLKTFHAGILAGIGISKIPVYRVPQVGILVTGQEVVEPGNNLKDGQIFNSNAYQLINSCRSLNIIPNYYGIVNDTYDEINSAIIEMLKSVDVLIITGGVSMGDFDFVAPALRSLGMELKFDSIAAQPGRPLTYATDGKKYCFGMPGNPVSCLVLFETIVKPLIYKIMGHDFKPQLFPFILGETILRRKAERKSFYPVKINDDNTVSPINYHGSAHINSYSEAFGIVAIEIGFTEVLKGEIIYVRQL